MKIFFTICFTLISSFVLGQIAIIYVKDGSCNVRSSGKKGNNIVDKLENGHLVYCFEQMETGPVLIIQKIKRNLMDRFIKTGLS